MAFAFDVQLMLKAAREAYVAPVARPNPNPVQRLTAPRPILAESPRRVGVMPEIEQLDLAAVGMLTAARIMARRASPEGAKTCAERRRAELAILDSEEPALAAAAVALLNECSACAVCPGVVMPRLQRWQDAARKPATPSRPAS